MGAPQRNQSAAGSNSKTDTGPEAAQHAGMTTGFKTNSLINADAEGTKVQRREDKKKT